MRISPALPALALTLLVCASANATIKIACVGDSITYGYGVADTGHPEAAYPAVLQSLLGTNYNVGNFGASGSTLLSRGSLGQGSGDAYINREQFVPSKNFNPDIILIMLGTNDGHNQLTNQMAGLTLWTNDYDNLVAQYTNGKAIPPKIYVATAPWPPSSAFVSQDEIGNRINPMIRDYASRRGYPLVDIWNVTYNTPYDGNSTTHLASDWWYDPVHPYIYGYSQIANAFYTSVTQTTYTGGSSNPPPDPSTNFIAMGATWQYYSTGNLPATNWSAKNYSDGSWSNGPAPLGYADPAIITTLPYGGVDSNKWITYYFRKHFAVTNTSSVTGLVADFIADDGAVIYLNGTKVFTSTNIIEPVSNTSLTTVAEPEPYVPKTFTIAPAGLSTGDNVLAVEVHQVLPTSSDVYFDLALNTVSFATTNQIGGGQQGSTNAPPSAVTNWTAYNDTAWHQDPNIFAGQGIDVAASTFTTNSPIGPINGALKATTGEALPVSVSFSGSAVVGMLARDLSIPAGTDLETVFAGKIGTNNAANWTSGTLTMTLSGLTTTKQYTVVIWSSRGGTSAAYSNRWTDITIKSVDSFANNSSAGLTKLTSAMANDETRVVAVIEGGKVARYDQVRSGADGTIVFDLTANGLASGDTNGYLNAFMVTEADVAAGNTNTVPDSWRIQYFGSTNAANAGIFEDFDHDGFSNFEEWRAGTDPTNAGSRLEFTAAAPVSTQGTQVVVSWGGVTGRTYSLLSTTNWVSGWNVSQSGIMGVSPMNVVTVNVANPKAFWRVKVE